MLLAFDFDGVLCDGMLEYWQIAWRTYCQVWLKAEAPAPEHIAPIFYRLRPVVETGWEMPVLVHAILQGFSEEELLVNWSKIAEEIIATEQIEPSALSQLLDSLRDRWIQTDLDGWLNLHRFYPGVVERLQRFLEESTLCFIVTTKEARFAAQLLRQGGIDFPTERIFGKDVKKPKYQTLKELSEKYQIEYSNIHFIEDRLKTLLSVRKQPDLDTVNLYLADWGYNTATERASVKDSPRIHLISLDKFKRELSEWS